MVLRFGPAKAEDVAELIARRNYTRAIEIVRAQLQAQKGDSRLRLQLGDVLALAGRHKEAAQVLAPLADEYAREGFAAKAVAILKKIQKLDPGRRDVDARLAELIEQKQRQATVVLPLVPPPGRSGVPALEIGIEEIGFEAPGGGGVSVPAGVPEPDVRAQVESASAPEAGPSPSLAAAPAAGHPLPAVERVPQPEAIDTAASPPLRDRFDPAPASVEVPAAPAPPAAVRGGAAAVLDHDLFTEDPELLLVDAQEPPLTLVAAEEPSSGDQPSEDPMSDQAFADELLGLVEGAFAGVPGGADGVPMPDHDIGSESGLKIVVSPLFKDFSVDEMVAVIEGLKLVVCEPRQVVLREGQPGDALYMLTAGTVKAYVRNSEGRQVLVGELHEGAFFGEMAVLTGRPRNATVVAATHCELLELDRAALADITARHPHVRAVLEEFARQRARRD